MKTLIDFTKTLNFTKNSMWLSNLITIPTVYPIGYYKLTFKGEVKKDLNLVNVLFYGGTTCNGAVMAKVNEMPFDGKEHTCIFYLEDPSDKIRFQLTSAASVNISFKLEYDDEIDLKTLEIAELRGELYQLQKTIWGLTDKLNETTSIAKDALSKAEQALSQGGGGSATTFNLRKMTKESYAKLTKKDDNTLYAVIR